MKLGVAFALLPAVFVIFPLGAAAVDLAPEERYRAAVAWLAAKDQAPFLEYVMDQANARRGRVIDTLTEDVVQRRADRHSWNLTTAGTMYPLQSVKIGRHYLIPDAFLPYRAESAPPGVLPGLDIPDPNGLKTIATVRSEISYAVTLIANENLEQCGDVAHLKLRPLRDPQRYNVRELWVRLTDNRLCKATFASRLFQEEGDATPYPTIDTAVLDDRGLITSWHSFVQFHFLIATVAGTNDGTFANVKWTKQEPAYLFDRSQWNAHAAENSTPSPSPSPTR
jgi:hypothetical protein